MGFLDPNSDEIKLISGFLLEAGFMLGTKVKMYLVNKANLDVYHDPSYDYEEEIEIDIVLDQRPQTKVLRHLHWYNENEEILPILAYISRYDWDDDFVSALKGLKLELPYQIGLNEGTRVYEVSDAKAFAPDGVYWVCRLTPVREEFVQEHKESKQDPNYQFLRIGDYVEPENISGFSLINVSLTETSNLEEG